jgi:DNA-binding transcriptional ArsR family regulator
MRLEVGYDVQSISEIGEALKNPTRQEILLVLKDTDCSLNELYTEHDVGNHRSGIHRHLKKLQQAGLIEKYLAQDTDAKTYRLVTDEIEVVI